MDVVIVGAGPAGLFLAHRLLALGPSHRVKLYDCNKNPTNLESFDSQGFGLGLGARVQHWLNSIEGLEEQLTCEGIEFTPGGLILIPRRQLCALLLQSLLTRYGNQLADADSRLSINYNALVVDVNLARHEVKIEKMAFLAAQPGHEYWNQCRCYHDLEGRAVLIGDAAHGMFSLLGQGCTAAIADAVALDSLLQQHADKWSTVLPQFSVQQVKEGHAASDLGLIALIFYHRWLGLLYKVATLLWVIVLRQPSIFARLNQVNANYVQVLHENRLWIWLAKRISEKYKTWQTKF